MKVKNIRVKNVSKNMILKIVKEKNVRKYEKISLRAQYVSVIKSVSKNVSKNVTLQNYERKKCCFKKSEREKGNS